LPGVGSGRSTTLSSAFWQATAFIASIISEYVCDQTGNEPVEEARLGEREAEPLNVRDLLTHLRLAGDRFHRLREHHPDADPGADCAEPAGYTDRHRSQSGIREGTNEHVGGHVRPPSFHIQTVWILHTCSLYVNSW